MRRELEESINWLFIDEDSTRAESFIQMHEGDMDFQLLHSFDWAQATIEHSHPQLICFHLEMDSQEGAQLVKTIRSHSDHHISNCYLLCLTSHTVQAVSELDVDNVIPTDIDKSEFNSYLNMALKTVNRRSSLEKLILEYDHQLQENSLAQAELYEAKIKAEESTQLKSDFLANMSHEIRTPMNGVLGASSLLLGTSLSEEQKEYVDIVKSSSEGLLTIINDILDFSKANSGKLNIESIPFDLKVCIKEISDLLLVQAGAKNIELVVDFDSDAPHHVFGDPGRVRQVLVNLVGNAIKFTDIGSVVVAVSYTEDKFFKFAVKDSGIGLPENQIDKLFEQFTQEDGSRTRKYGGTGLGLAISKQLTELMGGEIWAENREEGGACFTFTLPLPLDSNPNCGVLPINNIDDLRVLFVDNDLASVRELSYDLKEYVSESQYCSSPQEALTILQMAQAENQGFDMVVSTRDMPGMSGGELGLMIKKDERLKDISLVLMTGMGKRGEARIFEEIGFVGYLTTPIDLSYLIEAFKIIRGVQEEGIGCNIITQHTVNEQRELRKDVMDFLFIDERKFRVLIVEDNLVNQKVGRRILEKLKCYVEVATNGQEALELADKITYDMIFMDLQMPVMDGMMATRKIRELEGEKSKVPIVALTANAMEGDRQRCLEAGMNDYLAKPIKSESIKSMLDQWKT